MKRRTLPRSIVPAVFLLAAAGMSFAQEPIAQSVAGVTGSFGACRNTETRQTLSTALGGASSHDCTALGLDAVPGDTVLIAMAGASVCAPGSPCDVAGEVTGIEGDVAVCRNHTTAENVLVSLAGAASWNCTDSGLTVSPGDVVIQLVRGMVPSSEPLPTCTINFDGACPNDAPLCGASFAGGSDCVVAGLPFCYSTGLFGYEVPAGDILTIEMEGDLLSLDVFFGAGGLQAGQMTFFDSAGVQVDAPIFTNGNCAAAMPPSQALVFSRPVRSILVEAPAGNRVFLDTFVVNP